MSFRRTLPPLVLAAAALLLPACRRQGASAPALRVAVLPAEDLSPGGERPWLAQIFAFSLVRQLEGAPRLQLAEVRLAADLPGATHELAACLETRGGTLQAHLFLYELPSHKLLRHTVLGQPADGWPRLLESSAEFLASALQPAAALKPLAVRSEEAARHLAAALSAPSPAAARDAFRAAAEADPSCGWCWVGWAETSARIGDGQDARSALDAATRYRQRLDPLSLARLDVLKANLESDPRRAAAALKALVAASPSDPFANARLAEALVASREYEQAAGALRRAIELDPSNGALWNSLAYALAYMERFDEALDAVRRYAALDSSANPPDSRGEILMMAGRFREAADAFRQSYAKDRNFNGGAAMEKAALCWLLQGDQRHMEETIRIWLRDRNEVGDRMAEIHTARWEFLSGRPSAARARFLALARDAANPLAPIAASMLALRLAPAEPAAAASLLRTAAASRDGLHQLYAAYAAAAVNPASIESVRDDRLRAELSALSLTCRRDWAAAAAAWKNVRERAPGGTDGPWRELLAFSLVSAGRAAEAAAVIGKSWPLLSAGQMQFYDFLVYPALFYTRAEIARAEGRNEEAIRYYDLFLRFTGDRADLAQQAARARAAARL